METKYCLWELWRPLSNSSWKEKNIVFIGFMGAGKTTIGKLVAQKLYRDFIDIDEEIEKEYKMPIPQIFAEIGEKAFRAKEKEFIQRLCDYKLKIISVGGGAFLQEEIRNVCLSSCIVFYLDITWDAWKNRLGLIVDSRPVLHGKSMEEIEELFYKRQEIYKNNFHSTIEISHQDMEELAESIVESLKLTWELHETK
ncbi:shikimate kinase [Neobacillus vireti]|uniref:shikimate kinase n=1 Tax=Neobacillus vireti TaxID=220686 RepID=UPI003F689BBD